MIYLFYSRESSNEAKITLRYYIEPPKELGEDYIKVEYIPDAEIKKNKQAILYYNLKEKKIFYKYIDTFESKGNELQDRVDALEKSNGEMMALITTLSMPKM